MKRFITTLACTALLAGAATAQSFIIQKADGTTDVYNAADVEKIGFREDAKPTATAPEAVDLGLSVQWGAHNLGATTPDGQGWYVQWGNPELDHFNDYIKTESEYFLCFKDHNALMEMGVVDADGNLTPAHDAVTVALGEGWRLPTDAECWELLNNCTFECRFTDEGRPCFYVTSKKNGATIQIPLWGHMEHGTLIDCYDVRPDDHPNFKDMYDGTYFSATLNADADAYGFRVYYQGGRVYYNHASLISRGAGFQMRPVYDPK